MRDKKSNSHSIAILLPDMGPGGAERVALNLANEFVSRGFDVDLVLMRASGELLSELSNDIRIVNLSALRVRGVFLPLLRYLKARRPSALLVMMWPLTVLAICAAMFCRVQPRVVVSDHNALSRSTASTSNWRRWILRLSIRLLYPRAAAVVTVSQGVADDMTNFTGLKRNLITKIYNPVARGNLTAVMPADDVLGEWRRSGYKYLIAVGTLKPQKDYETLLVAFAKLCKDVRARLLILGDGPLRNILALRAEQLGISEDVLFKGYVKDPFPFYMASDLFVLSSAYEGFGNVLVEALECGLPIVSTDCVAGPREILADGQFGRLVPVGDSSSLAAAMKDMLSVSVDKQSHQARARLFSVQSIANQYISVLLPNVRRNTHA